MVRIDVEALGKEMCAAAAGSLKGKWPKIKALFEPEVATVCAEVAKIQERLSTGDLTEARAQILLEMQVEALRAVALASLGIAKLELEAAINAAISVLNKAISRIVPGMGG
jgi:hypothetical protein